MKKYKHETKAFVTSLETNRERATYCGSFQSSTRVDLSFLDGGNGHFVLPGSQANWAEAIVNRTQLKITLELELPERLDILENILRDKGTIAALDYARRELSK